MFRIKICGITRPRDAEVAVEAGADAIGLNFYRSSPRFVEVEAARRILDVVRGRVLAVGVFVDAPPESIVEVVRGLDLDLVQLSGNDSVQQLRMVKGMLNGVPLMQALRTGSAGLAGLQSHLEACRKLDCLPQLVLWDTQDPVQFGGTGRLADWTLAATCAARDEFPPLILAGGLNPQNVAAGIRAVRPRGVDTASGVEESPGVKDAEKMRSFITAARDAFDNPAVAD